MFGSKKRLRERLQAEGVRAPAVVVRAEPTTTTHGPPNGGVIDRKWKLGLKVQPGGRPEFEVDVSEYFRPSTPPNVGSSMDVFFDPNDQTQVCIDIPSLVSAAPSIAADTQAESAGAREEMATWSLSNPPSLRKQWKMRDQMRALQMSEAMEGRDGKVFVQGAGVSDRGGATDPKEQLAQLEAMRASGQLSEAQFRLAKRFLPD